MVASDPLCPQAVPIVALQHETDDVFTLVLDASVCQDGTPFRPGQFMMLYVFGVGEVPISISGDMNDTASLVHTIRAVGGVTRALQQLQVGDTVGVRGPYGSAWPLEEARGRDVVILAGGIGLAPLRPFIYYLLNHREDYGHINICYGTRAPGDIIYSEEIQQWRARDDINMLVTVDHGSRAWRGDVGVVTELMDRLHYEPANTIALTCGPEIMMRFGIRKLHDLGITDEQVYLSMERNMHCAVGFCGHCQYGPLFICKDGPVFPYERIEPFFGTREL